MSVLQMRGRRYMHFPSPGVAATQRRETGNNRAPLCVYSNVSISLVADVTRMNTSAKTTLLSITGFWIVLLAASACQSQPDPSNATREAPSGRNLTASVSGTVTYRERLALSANATLIVELRDVSYADGPAPLIARQTIAGPGQVPIEFEVRYSREDIDSRNTYAVQARIMESDVRLAFINDTAYEVITRGNPDEVAMLLTLVQPPPDQTGGSDRRAWVEVPVAIMRVTLMQPPPTPWAIPCHEQLVELDTVEAIGAPLEPGQTYRVIVNDRVATTFTLPEPHLRGTFIAESPIDSATIVKAEAAPPQYQLHVVSGMPKGSSCSQFNGYEIRREESNRIDVVITHHQVADPLVACTEDYLIVEAIVPLGSNLEPGVEYTVSVNSDTVTSFVAR